MRAISSCAHCNSVLCQAPPPPRMHKRSGYDGVTIFYYNRVISNTQDGIEIFVINIKLTLTIKIKYVTVNM